MGYEQKLLAAVNAVPGLGDFAPGKGGATNKAMVDGPVHNDKLVNGRKLKFWCMGRRRVPAHMQDAFFEALKKEFRATKVGFTQGGDLYVHIPADAATNARPTVLEQKASA